MTLDMMNAGARDPGARETVICGDEPEHIATSSQLQVRRLRRHFNLPPATASLLAPLVFGEVTA